MDSHLAPITGKFLVGSVPCMLVFLIDNEYSWMREKLVSYRITVTPPSPEVLMSGRELEEKKKSLQVAEREEKWLVTRVGLRKEQYELLNKRLTEGWADEPSEC